MSYPEESLYWKGRGMDSSQSEPVVSSNGQGEAAESEVVKLTYQAPRLGEVGEFITDFPDPVNMVERVTLALIMSIKPGVPVHVAARAAIEAMRTPTEAMLDAGPGDPYLDGDVWSQIIDAALKPSSGATAPRTATTAD